MSNPFLDNSIFSSPYERPRRHWELDEHGQSAQKMVENRRKADFITLIFGQPKRVTVAIHEAGGHPEKAAD